MMRKDKTGKSVKEDTGVNEETEIAPDESSEVKPEKEKTAKKKSGRPRKTPLPAMDESLTGSEERVTVTSLWLGELKVKNTPSGEDYAFERSGAEVAVRIQDIEFLRQKNADLAACCGSAVVKRRYFEIP